MTIPDCITEAHLRWANEQGCSITAGEVGFGRPCVGLLKSGSWVDYSSWDYGSAANGYEMTKIEGAYDSWVPQGAYEKHECVALDYYSGDPTESWQQLALWLDVLIAEGWEVYDRERKVDISNPLDLMFHGTHTPTLRKGNAESGAGGQEKDQGSTSEVMEP